MNLIVVVVVPTPLLLLLLFHVPNTQVVAPRSHDAGHNWPETETCEIHLVSLGLRYLEPFGMGDVTNPAYHILAPNFPNRNARRKHLHDLLPVDGGSTDDDTSGDDRDDTSNDDTDGEEEEGTGGDDRGQTSDWKREHGAGGGGGHGGSSDEDDENQEGDDYETSMYGGGAINQESKISATGEDEDEDMPGTALVVFFSFFFRFFFVFFFIFFHFFSFFLRLKREHRP